MNFDDKAKTWDSDPIKRERAFAVAAAIRQRVPLAQDWRALEYGCGTGLLSFALHAELGRIALADSSPGMLAVLEDKIAATGFSHLHPLALDLVTDPLPAERYDLIYTLMTLHHVADVDRLLRAFHDLLRPSSWLCIADLDQEDGSIWTRKTARFTVPVLPATTVLIEPRCGCNCCARDSATWIFRPAIR